MSSFFCRIFLCLAFLLAPVTARAATDLYNFDKQHTQILFDVGNITFSHSHGAFQNFSGYFLFNAREPQKSRVRVRIPTTSISMADESLNEKLKGPDFFNVKKFPVMTFVAKGITPTSTKTGRITGDLTLLGITKPVTLDVTFTRANTHPITGDYVAGFSAKTTLHRSDFGMTYGIPLISDNVDIRIEAEGIKKAKRTENE